MDIAEKVLTYLKEQPGNAVEIGEALSLTKLGGWSSYNWGNWNFEKAKRDGIIEWKNDKWYLKMQSPKKDYGGETMKCDRCEFEAEQIQDMETLRISDQPKPIMLCKKCYEALIVWLGN